MAKSKTIEEPTMGAGARRRRRKREIQ